MTLFRPAKNESEGGTGLTRGEGAETTPGSRHPPVSSALRKTQLAQAISRILRKARGRGSGQRSHMARL